VERRGQFQIYTLNTTIFQDLTTEVLDWFGAMETPAHGSADEPEHTSDVSTEDTKYESLS
ncbi:MAG: hypothetical protein ACRDHW_01340, partial [Ktedonobacteraceae bacterium]